MGLLSFEALLFVVCSSLGVVQGIRRLSLVISGLLSALENIIISAEAITDALKYVQRNLSA